MVLKFQINVYFVVLLFKTTLFSFSSNAAYLNYTYKRGSLKWFDEFDSLKVLNKNWVQKTQAIWYNSEWQ